MWVTKRKKKSGRVAVKKRRRGKEMSILRALGAQRHQGRSRAIDDTSTIHGAVGVIARHYDAICRLIDAYKDSPIASLGDIDYLVQKAEWAINRHLYPIFSALDAMDQLLVEWYRTKLITDAQTEKNKYIAKINRADAERIERLIIEISNMTEDEVKDKLIDDMKAWKKRMAHDPSLDPTLGSFVKENGFFENVGEVQEMERAITKWKEYFDRDKVKKAFEARKEELNRVMGMDNEEDVDKNLRVVRYMVRLAETKIPLIERIADRIKNGGLLMHESVSEADSRMTLEEIDGEQRLIINGKSLPEWVETGRYMIRHLEIQKELHDVKCRTKPKDKASEFKKIIDRELKDLRARIDDDSRVLSERIKKAGSVADIGHVNADISYRLMGRNMMIGTIKEFVENMVVVVPTISYDHTGADELRAGFEEVRKHKKLEYIKILNEVIAKLNDHIINLLESLHVSSNSARTFEDVEKIKVEMSSKINETYKVIGLITPCIMSALQLDDYYAIPTAMNDQINALFAHIKEVSDFTDTVITHLKGHVAPMGARVSSTSFGRYVHRVARNTPRVPYRAWIA
jgi:hypothetical protein